MTYLYELYDDSFVFEVENNEENISESHMKFFVHLYDFRFFEKTGEMNESEFKGKVKLVEHIFVNAKALTSAFPSCILERGWNHERKNFFNKGGRRTSKEWN
jgi:hypothetical protein